MPNELPKATDLTAFTSQIVAAFVSHNALNPTDLVRLVAEVHASLLALKSGPAVPPAEELKPAVPIKKSVTPDHIVCLEDGLKFKSLKRHLMAHYGMTPQQYRDKWGLPGDYPMVASNYSAIRSQLAKDSGLGRRPRAESAAQQRSPRAKASANLREKRTPTR